VSRESDGRSLEHISSVGAVCKSNHIITLATIFLNRQLYNDLRMKVCLFCIHLITNTTCKQLRDWPVAKHVLWNGYARTD
jgi:hypothetical protein